MQAVHAGAYPSGHSASFIERLNAEWHEVALRTFMVIVLAHWGEHLTQAFQIYALGWPVPESRGLLGQFFPWLVKSETLHYGYALVMLVGLFVLRKGFTDVKERRWWTIALAIQFFHHIEHGLLQIQAFTGHRFLRSPGPNESRPALGPASGAAPLLQHDRLHSDGDRDVLPPVPDRAGRDTKVHVCIASSGGCCRLKVGLRRRGRATPRRLPDIRVSSGVRLRTSR